MLDTFLFHYRGIRKYCGRLRSFRQASHATANWCWWMITR